MSQVKDEERVLLGDMCNKKPCMYVCTYVGMYAALRRKNTKYTKIF